MTNPVFHCVRDILSEFLQTYLSLDDAKDIHYTVYLIGTCFCFEILMVDFFLNVSLV